MRSNLELLDNLKFYVLNIKLWFWVVDGNVSIRNFVWVENIFLKKNIHLEHALILETILLVYRQFLLMIDLKLNRVLMDHKKLFVNHWGISVDKI